jgi:hypothetical protein
MLRRPNATTSRGGRRIPVYSIAACCQPAPCALTTAARAAAPSRSAPAATGIRRCRARDRSAPRPAAERPAIAAIVVRVECSETRARRCGLYRRRPDSAPAQSGDLVRKQLTIIGSWGPFPGPFPIRGGREAAADKTRRGSGLTGRPTSMRRAAAVGRSWVPRVRWRLRVCGWMPARAWRPSRSSGTP